MRAHAVAPALLELGWADANSTPSQVVSQRSLTDNPRHELAIHSFIVLVPGSLPVVVRSVIGIPLSTRVVCGVGAPLLSEPLSLRSRLAGSACG